MTEGACRCGHGRARHVGSRCNSYLRVGPDGWGEDPCRCREYDDSRLPAPGERAVFGVHRLREQDAVAAPAWRPDSEAARERRFRSWAKGAIKDIAEESRP